MWRGKVHDHDEVDCWIDRLCDTVYGVVLFPGLAKKIETALLKPNIGACMLERSRACVTCARLSRFFLARVVLVL